MESKNCVGCAHDRGYFARRRCGICEKEFRCDGFSLTLESKTSCTAFEYRSVCPACGASICQFLMQLEQPAYPCVEERSEA